MQKKRRKNSLSGLRILVGRARHQASALSSGFRKLGAQVLEIPFIEIRKPRSYRQLDTALKDLPDYEWLILTSVNGVEAVFDRLKTLRIRNPALQHLQIAAIGPATRKAIEDHGFKVDVVPKQYVAESVVASLRHRVRGKRMLLARAKVARDVIPRELRKLGARVDVVEAYETVLPQASRARLAASLKDPKRRPNVIAFTSSSTVRNFAELLDLVARGSSQSGDRRRLSQQKKALLDGVHFASIGPVTSATLRELGLAVDIEAKQFTIPGLVKAIVSAHA
jgi:uroporphyrinogen-III synthase